MLVEMGARASRCIQLLIDAREFFPGNISGMGLLDEDGPLLAIQALDANPPIGLFAMAATTQGVRTGIQWIMKCTGCAA